MRHIQEVSHIDVAKRVREYCTYHPCNAFRYNGLDLQIDEIDFALIPLIVTIVLYVVFYSRILCKPDHAGFWFILALGMSIGVALTRFIQWSKETDNE